jgi:hypothetical protein
MRKTIISMILILYALASVIANDFEHIDQLHDNGKYGQALSALRANLDPASPQAAILHRICKSNYEIANAIQKRKPRIKAFETAMKEVEIYLKNSQGSKRDRATLYHWYGILSSKRAESVGVFESLGNVPNLMNILDKSLSIDPTFTDPYYIKGMIHKAVPFGKYGDKYLMSVYFSRAVKGTPDNIFMLTDFAKALDSRNWNTRKKQRVANKNKTDSDGTPMNLTDREYAIKVAQMALQEFDKKTNPSLQEKKKIKEAEELLGKLL